VTCDTYRHENARRLNNPTAALAREDIAHVPHRTYSRDPHLPPELVWAGKAEQTNAPSRRRRSRRRVTLDAMLKAARQENAQIALYTVSRAAMAPRAARGRTLP
jgi:adenine-specific DNA-methyltransferase